MRFWKKRLQRVAAMVCSVALVASMMPTAAFATEPETTTPTPEPTPVVETTPTPEPSESPVSTDATVSTSAPGTDAGSTSAPEATPAGNTDDTKEPVESPEPSEVPAEQEQPAPQMLAAAPAPAANGEPEARDSKVIYSDADAGINVQLGDKWAAIPQKVTFVVSVDGVQKTSVRLDSVPLTAAPLKVDADNWNCNVYGDGVGVTLAVGGYNLTFNSSKDEYTVHIDFKSPTGQLTMKNADGSIDLGTVTYKTGWDQNTTIRVYLNYELVQTFEDVYISASNEVADYNNFQVKTNGDYYLKGVKLVDSSIGGQTVGYTESNQHLFFGLPYQSGENTIALYFFDYKNGVNVDFSRLINDLSFATSELDKACDTLNLTFTYNGRNISYDYNDWGRLYLPKGVDITVTPTIKSGYYFEYWRTSDAAATENALYSVLPDASLQLEGEGTAFEGLLALTEKMRMHFEDSDYPDMNIHLYMTDGTRHIVHKKITYNSNYPLDAGMADISEQQYFYSPSNGLRHGTRILGEMPAPTGYRFLYWTTGKDGSGTKYMPGDLYGTDGSGDMTLYARWEKIETPQPEIPEVNVDALGAKIKVVCDTPDSGHEDDVWEENLRGAAPKDFEIKHDALSNTATVTIKNTDVYVKVYNEKVAPGHVYQEDGSDLSFKLKYENDAWALDPEDSMATILVSCPKATVKKAITSVERDGKPLNPVPEMLKVGDKINYQIEITNDSNITLEDLTVTDTFTGEGGFTFSGEGTGSVKMNDEGFVWSLDIAPKDSEVLNYSYTVVDADKGNTITNTATVAGAGLPDEPGDETETEVENPDVTVTKSLTTITRNGESVIPIEPTTELKVGDEITYEIKVENTGNVNLSGLTVTDKFSGYAKPGDVQESGSAVTGVTWQKGVTDTDPNWTLTIDDIDLSVEQSKTYTYTYTVNQADAGNNLTNTAAVSGDNIDPDDEKDDDERPVKDDGTVTMQPADITIYVGGEKGYTGVVDGEGNIVQNGNGSESLPEPGFYFTLPDEINRELSAALGEDPDAAVDLSKYIKVTAMANDDKPRTWTLKQYGATTSTALIGEGEAQRAHFVYEIEPAADQDPIRVQFTHDGKMIVSDKFDVTNALYEEYGMSLYLGGVDRNTIAFVITIPEAADGSTPPKTYYCGFKESEPATLTVRYASDAHTTTKAVTNGNEIDTDNFGLLVEDGQKFNINQKDAGADGVDVTAKDVSLLVDSLVGGEDYTYTNALYSKAVTAAGFKSSGVWGQYLDLVDAENGNAWLTPKGEVTVFWPYPAGVTKDTGTIKLYHFVGLDRDMATGDVMAEINDTDAVEVPITRLDDGFTFKTSSFSPFVLVQDTTQPSGGDDGNNDNNNNNTNTKNQTTTVNVANQAAAPAAAPAAAIPQTGDALPVGLLGGVAAAAAAAFAALFVLRKRKHDD